MTRGGIENQTRDILVEYIRGKPGISFGELMSFSRMNEGTLRYHLRYLEKLDFISSKKVGRRRLYHACNISNKKTFEESRLTIDQMRVIKLIMRKPGIKPKEILDMVDLSRKGLLKIINKLKKDHMIFEVENGNGVGYEYITRERLVEELLLELVDKLLTGKIDQPTFMRMKKWIEERDENF